MPFDFIYVLANQSYMCCTLFYFNQVLSFKNRHLLLYTYHRTTPSTIATSLVLDTAAHASKPPSFASITSALTALSSTVVTSKRARISCSSSRKRAPLLISVSHTNGRVDVCQRTVGRHGLEQVFISRHSKTQEKKTGKTKHGRAQKDKH